MSSDHKDARMDETPLMQVLGRRRSVRSISSVRRAVPFLNEALLTSISTLVLAGGLRNVEMDQGIRVRAHSS